jgi:hypothetical protein
METNLKKEYDTLRKYEESILEDNKDNLTYKREDFFNIPWNDTSV